jgi:hypothetical protein
MHISPIPRKWVVAALLSLAACDGADPYRDRFPLLKTGDARSRIVAVMGGDPDADRYIEVAGLRVERMTWRANKPFGATYTVDCVAEHLIVKTAMK